jgi:hypothetical protein
MSRDDGAEGSSLAASLPGTEAPSLVELMRMSYEEWDVWTRGSAIRRAGYAGRRFTPRDGPAPRMYRARSSQRPYRQHMRFR